MKTTIFILSFFFALEVAAQSNVIFDKIDQTNGLSTGTTSKIVQDSFGFIWIATQNGLNRYDGYSFKLYDAGNSNLPSDNINELFIDNKDRMWVGTSGGISIYDNEIDKFSTFVHDPENATSIASNDINVIFQDIANRIWIGSEKGLSLYHEESKTYTNYCYLDSNPYSLSNNSVRAIYQDNKGRMWIGTSGGGLNLFDVNSQQFYHYRNMSEKISIYLDDVRAITSLEEDKLILGTYGIGLMEFDLATNTLSPYLDSAYNHVTIIRALHLDRRGILWIGSDGQGLFALDTQDPDRKVVQYESNASIPHSLVNNAVYSIFEDTEDNIWIGTVWKGINVLRRNNSHHDFFYSDFAGLNPVGVLSVLGDETSLWLGTDGKGVSKYDYDTKKITYYNKNNQIDLGGEYYQFLKKDKYDDELLWLGTFKNGLMYFHQSSGEIRKFKQIPNDPTSISNNSIRDIFPLSKKKYLVATWGGGLNVLDMDTFKFTAYRHSSVDSTSISSDNVTSLLDAGNGKVWMTTFGGGLNLFDPITEEFTRFQYDKNNDNTISGDNLVSIIKDSKGDLWIGTWGKGLVKFNVNEQQFERFQFDDKFAPNTITSLLEDRKGNIWMGTKTSIFCLNTTTKTLRSFNDLAGEYHTNGATKNKDGKFFFGNTKGVVSFFPEEVYEHTEKSLIRFTGIKVYNKPSDLKSKDFNNSKIDEQLTFAHDQNVLTFDFAALNYPFSRQNEYAVKLSNFSDKWIHLGKQRSVTFSNLAPGDYELTVKTASNNNWENASYSSIKLSILKPWWREWWAISIYLILLLTLLYYFRYFIIAWEKMKTSLKLEKMSHEKDSELHNLKLKFFTNISHEIRTPLTLILGSIFRMEENGVLEKRNKNHLSVIEKNGNHLLQLVNELLDFRKLETAAFSLKVSEGNIVKFIKEVFLSFQGQAIEKNINYELRNDVDSISLWYDKDQMEKVLYNLLANAFKFTENNGSITIEIKEDDEHLFIAINDTGKGISKKHLNDVFKRFYQSDNALAIKDPGTGLGLSIAHEIVKLHRGEIAIESEKNLGTNVVIKLQFGNDHFSPNQLLSLPTDSDDLTNYVKSDNYIEDIDLSELGLYNEYKILVVEDNDGVRDYIVDILQTEYQISEAKNGLQALNQIENDIPDLIICDVVMPEMDGITLTERVKSNKKTSHIPVIILTARTSLIYKKEGYETGADAYITKPFSEVLLKTRIKNILKNKVLLREKLRNEFITQPKELAINSPDQQFLQDIINIIESNIDKHDLKVGFISQELAMSHSVVYKKIKALTGFSLIEFIRDYKLKRAAQLMSVNQLNIADACFKVGFSDRKYFSQIFKGKFGMTPSEYIKEKQN